MPAKGDRKYSNEDIVEEFLEFYEDTDSTSVSDYVESDYTPCLPTIVKYFGSWGTLIDEAGIPHDFVKCPECLNYYDSMGNHWRYNEECRPEINQRKWDIIVGLLMGDASLVRDTSKNTYLQCNMTKKEFLDWVDGELGIMSRGVKFHESAEERARKDRETGFNPGADPDNYSDQYKIETRAHPKLNELDRWYPEPRTKVFPDDIELTPVKFTVWFCCDGSCERADSEDRQPIISIASSNEVESDELFEDIFEEFPVELSFIKHERDGRTDGRFDIDVKGTKWMWEWMEDPPPGFGYKWPEDFRNSE